MRYPKWLGMLCTIGLLCLQTTLAQAAPQNGWWWNPNQSGRGYSIEIQGDTLFMAGYLYENDGHATWLVSGGLMQNATTYAGRLLAFSNGQTLTGNYQAPAAPSDAGAVTLQFSDDTHATLTWPGGALAIERFRYGSAAAASFQPENGWWWNAAESGRGFFIEVQGDKMFVAGYMYDANGKAVWYVSGGAMTSPTSYQGDWLQFANGQTLLGPYVAPSAPVKAGTVSLSFSAPDQATLTLADNHQPAVSKIVPIKPFLTKQPQTTGTPVATAVGVPSGSAASATIGAAGGSVSAPDGKLALTIPAGALSMNTVISIQPLTNMAHGKIGAAYRLTPEGQTFLQPVTLTFKYADPDLLGSAVEALGAAFQTATGFWQWAGDATVDTVAKTVSVSSNHFSDWSLLKGFQIRPPSKTVKVKESVALQVALCLSPDVNNRAPLMHNCDSDEETTFVNRISEWSVNGRIGGGRTFGTVLGSGATATYTAPTTEPTPNSVDVSALVDFREKGKTRVVSIITIAEDSWTGTATGVGDDGVGKITAAAQVTWTLESTNNKVATYRPTGVVSPTVAFAQGFPCTASIDPSSSALDPAKDGTLTIDYNFDPPTYHGRGFSVSSATMTIMCEGESASVTNILGGGNYFGGSGGEAKGVVSPDGVTIEGSDTDTQFSPPITYQWKFTRNK